MNSFATRKSGATRWCGLAAEWVDPLELGQWQREQRLPVTCVQDKATRSRLRP